MKKIVLGIVLLAVMAGSVAGETSTLWSVVDNDLFGLNMIDANLTVSPSEHFLNTFNCYGTGTNYATNYTWDRNFNLEFNFYDAPFMYYNYTGLVSFTPYDSSGNEITNGEFLHNIDTFSNHFTDLYKQYAGTPAVNRLDIYIHLDKYDLLGLPIEMDFVNYNCTIIYDYAGPAAPVSSYSWVTETTSELGFETFTPTGFKINWSAVDDCPALYRSGVKGYDLIQVAGNNTLPTQGTPDFTPTTPPSSFFKEYAITSGTTGGNFARGYRYIFAIQARDNLDNLSAISNITVPIPPAIPNFETPVVYDPANPVAELLPTIVDGYPCYPVQLTFVNNLDAFYYAENGVMKSYYDRMMIYYQEHNADDSWSNATSILSISLTSPYYQALFTGHGKLQPVENNTKLRVLLKLRNSATSNFSHKTVRFYAVVFHNSGVIPEAGFASAAVTIPNLPADFKLKVSRTDGTNNGTAMLVDKDGYKYPEGGKATLATMENADEKMVFELNDTATTESGEWKDGEGDILTFDIKTINNNILVSAKGALDTPGEYNTPFKSLLDCYATVYETPPGQTEWVAKQETLHAVTSGEEGFSLNFNKAEPYYTFTVHTTDNDSYALNLDYLKAGKRDVWLKVQQTTSDKNITGITIWNVIPTAEKYLVPGEITAVDIAASYAETAVKTNYNFNELPEYLPWTLPDTSEVPAAATGYRIIAAKATTADGLDCYFWRAIGYDTSPPEQPTGIHHNYNENLDRVYIKFTPSTTPAGQIEEYLLSYTDKAGQEQTLTIDAGSSEFNVDMTTIGYNKEVGMKVCAKGINGGIAGWVEYQFTTTPKAGSAENRNQGYNVETGDIWLQWTMHDGIAAYYTTAYKIAGAPEYGETSARQDGPEVSVHELATRNGYSLCSYDIKIQAWNTPGTESHIVELTNVTLGNLAPVIPQLIKPGAYSTQDVQFEWRTNDPDGDAITSRLFVREQGKTWQEGTPAAGYFTHGTTYEWYVKTADMPPADLTPLESQSMTAQFTIDNAAPIFSIAGVPNDRLFTNQEDLTVNSVPSLSGTARIDYWYTDETNVVSATYTAIPGSNGTATIPLAELQKAYTVTVKATSGAGISTTQTTDTLRVDRHGPQISAYDIGIKGDADDLTAPYYTDKDYLSFSATLTDEYAGVKEVIYSWLDDLSQDAEPGIVVPITPNPGLTNTQLQKTLLLEGEEGQSCYLVLQVYDYAGNESVLLTSDRRVLKDALPPLVELNVDGLVHRGGNYYLAHIDNITHVAATGTDAASGVAETLYGLSAADAEPAAWYATWDEVKQLAQPLTAGSAYRAAARVTDKAGHATVRKSPVFVYDNSAPVNVALVNTLPNPWVSGETLHLQVQATDVHSPVAAYRMAIGKLETITGVSAGMAGNNAGWLESASGSFICTLPAVENAGYMVVVEAMNAAGLTSTRQYYAVELRNRSERIIVRDPGAYQTTDASFTVSWEYAGSEAISGYEYRLLGDGLYDGSWITTLENHIELTGLSLVNGSTYTFEVQAKYGVLSGYTPVTATTGTRVDMTVPDCTGFTVPVACSRDNFEISWNAEDLQSGIKQVQVLLEHYAAENDRQQIGGGWIDLEPAAAGSRHLWSDAQGNPLEFTDGERIYCTLRIINGAELLTERTAAPLIYDNSAPPEPLVTDQGGAVNPEQAAGLEGDWFFSREDAESGNQGYWWAVYEDNTEEVDVWEANLEAALPGLNWHADDGSHRVNLAEADLGAEYAPVAGSKWYFIVKAVNNAGLTSIGYSNGITIDDTAPIVSDVKLLQGAVVDEVRYIKSNENLYVHIDAYDDISVITGYLAGYGTWDMDENWVPGAGEYSGADTPVGLLNPAPVLAEGERVWFSGKACSDSNQEGTGYSAGTILDTTKPVVEIVSGSYMDGRLIFSWESSAAIAPVTGYNVELWRTDVASTEAAFTVSGYKQIAIEIDCEALNLADGRYQLRVTAQNGAGTWSDEAGSEPVLMDRIAPVASVEVIPWFGKYCVGRYMNFVMKGQEEMSGIAEYRYCIGTASDMTNITGGWRSVFKDIAEYRVTLDFENDLAGGMGAVPDREWLYVHMQVIDRSGVASEIVTGAPVQVDKTAPDTPLVSVSKEYYNSENTIDGIDLDLHDAESGIGMYEIAIVPSNDPAWLETHAVNWAERNVASASTRVLLEDIETGGLQMAHKDRLYAAVRTMNCTGALSAPGYSPAFTIDVVEPQLTFAAAGSVPVYNDGPFNVAYTLADDTTGATTVKFVLTSNAQGLDNIDWNAPPFLNSNQADGDYVFTYDFNDGSWGEYQLYALLTDKAGNTAQSAVQVLRVNRPPRIAFDWDYIFFPMRPDNLSAVIEDEDNGDNSFIYEWKIWNGETGVTDFNTLDSTPLIALPHTADWNQQSYYAVEVRVTDDDGGIATAVNRITIVNTREGELCTDEYWSGEHTLIGNVIVPTGKKLTIAANTKVYTETTGNDEIRYRLQIDGTLDASPGAQFGKATGNPGYWDGIWVTGKADIILCSVQDAYRGLVIGGGSDVMLNGTTFDRNRVGVHVFKAGQEITWCTFNDSAVWGVKEEGVGARVNNGRFDGNLMDYYAYDNPRMTVALLNERDGCEGNE